MSLYPKQNSEALGEMYIRHVEAMTAEKLHEKSDIAAQLAWRDKALHESNRMMKALDAILDMHEDAMFICGSDDEDKTNAAIHECRLASLAYACASLSSFSCLPLSFIAKQETP